VCSEGSGVSSFDTRLRCASSLLRMLCCGWDGPGIIMKEWNEIWKTEEGRAGWLTPDPWVVSLLPRFKKAGLKRVLDLGFGLGRHSILLARKGFEVHGIESSPEGLEFAMEWADREAVAVNLSLGDMSRLPYGTDSFDLVLAWNVIYHGRVDYIRSAIAEIERCLRWGGYLVCSLISTKNDQYGLGQEIEEGTYVVPGHFEKSHPHHYFDRYEVEAFLSSFALLECQDVPGSRFGSYHWQILARPEQ
jgi:tellurite methyltransferase